MNTKQLRIRFTPLFSAVHFASEFGPCGEVAAGPFGFAKLLELFNRPSDNHGRRTTAKLRQFFRKTLVLFGQRYRCFGRGHGVLIGKHPALAQGESKESFHGNNEKNLYLNIPKNNLEQVLISKPNYTPQYPNPTK